LGSLLAFRITTNPLTQIVSGNAFGVITFDSKELLQFYSATVQGNEFVANIGGEEIRTKFNRGLQWYFSKILKKGEFEVKNESDSSKTVVFSVNNADAETLSSSMFKTEYPFLLYSTELKSFISKEWLHAKEKDSMLFSQGWELNKAIREHNKNAGGITRYIMELIAQKSSNGSPLGNIFIWIIIIVFVLALASVILPDVITAFNAPDQAADQLVADKLK
jgi:hypothetical protein